MTNLEFQVLKVMSWYGSKGLVTDIMIYKRGQSYFGKDWAGGSRYSPEYDYCPGISLALGRLAKRGLVAADKTGGACYSHWYLTKEGHSFSRGIEFDPA